MNRVYFDYDIEKWMFREYILLFYDYILLTPKDNLTKDQNWINTNELKGDFWGICHAIPNDQLRSEINEFYRLQLPTKSSGQNTLHKIKLKRSPKR